ADPVDRATAGGERVDDTDVGETTGPAAGQDEPEGAPGETASEPRHVDGRRRRREHVTCPRAELLNPGGRPRDCVPDQYELARSLGSFDRAHRCVHGETD